MTEYTPTTTEVRDRFARDLFDNADRPVRESFRLFDRWLAEHDREVAERAWDEGYRQGWGDRHDDFHAGYVPSGFEQDTLNPYRKEVTGD